MVGFSMKIKKDEIQKKKTTGAFSINKNRVMVPKKIIMSNNAEDEDDDDNEFKKISIQTLEDLKPDAPKEIIIPLHANKSLITARNFEKEAITPSNTNTNDKLSFGLNILEPKSSSNAQTATTDILTTTTTNTTTTTSVVAAADAPDTTNLPNDESQKQESMSDQARASLLSNEDIDATTIPRNNDKKRVLTASALLVGNDNHHHDADNDDEPNYSKISVDDFGLAFLKGLGYKPDQDTRAKEVAEQDKKRRKKYGNQIGLGSK